MKLVVDTSIIISALMRDSTSRKILLHPKFEFYTPEFALLELKKHEELIIQKSGLSSEAIRLLIQELFTNIKLVPAKEYERSFEAALEIMKEIDEKDTPFLALALSFENEGIWSQDKDFSMQSKVKCWSTETLIKLT